jgi:hypothetical protein
VPSTRGDRDVQAEEPVKPSPSGGDGRERSSARGLCAAGLHGAGPVALVHAALHELQDAFAGAELGENRATAARRDLLQHVGQHRRHHRAFLRPGRLEAPLEVAQHRLDGAVVPLLERQVENVELEEGLFLFDTPLPIPAFGEATLGTFGLWWLAIAVLFAGGATINTFVAGIPRILYGMAKDTAFPPAFGYLHPRFKTPVVGIALVVLIPAVYSIVIRGDIDSIFVLILAAVMAWLFSYILVNISIITLRRRRPDLHRPYRSPLYPVPQILASIGMLVTMWYIAPPFLSRADIYLRFFIMLGVVALFAVWQTVVKTKKPLFEPVEPEELLREELGTT